MKIIDYIKMAVKNLFRQKLRTFLTVIAITVGSLSIILMGTILINMRQSVIDQLHDMGAFNLVTVSRDPNASESDNPQLLTNGNNGPAGNEGKLIDDNTVATVKKMKNVADATPTMSVWVKTIQLKGNDKKVWGNIMAYDPKSNVFTLPLKAGRELLPDDMDKIIVGGDFVRSTGYSENPKDLIGKKAVLNYGGGGGARPDWGKPPEKPPQNADKSYWENIDKNGVPIEAEIIGVVDDSMGDTGQNYVTLAWAKRLMTQVRWEYDENSKTEKFDKESSKYTQNEPVMKLVKDDFFKKDGYGSIIIKVNDEKNIREVAQEVEKMGYGATTAEHMLAQINKVIGIIGLVLSVIGGISLFVAAIGIINTMIMATYERTREIGVMRACGATKGVIRNLFTLEAGLLGFWGGVFGLIISFILITVAGIMITNNPGDLANLPIQNLGQFPLWLMPAVVAFTTFVGTVSGLYPALRAARLKPVDALRYE